MVRVETLTMRSKGQKMSTNPGPRGCLPTRPRKKVTARSYSCRMLIQRDSKMIPTKTIRKKPKGAIGPMSKPPPRDPSSELPDGPHRQGHVAHRDHFHRFPFRHRLLRHRVPDLAVDEHPPLRPHLRTGHAALVEQPLA